mmetsp:Transcript_14966/g.44025  ORF Transcript_14966/g.44025 Transcript_14966/m.44025 type:complete len:82 (+) Transcript_14966:3077-3322(+)
MSRGSEQRPWRIAPTHACGAPFNAIHWLLHTGAAVPLYGAAVPLHGGAVPLHGAAQEQPWLPRSCGSCPGRLLGTTLQERL